MLGPRAGAHRAARRSPDRICAVWRAAPAAGQGARPLPRRRRRAHRRHRPDLGLRLRARLGHSRQGAGADAAVGLLVRAHRRHRPQPRHHRRRGSRSRPVLARRRRRSCAAGRCWSAAPRRCRSNASPAATCRGRGGRTTWRPARCAATRCRPGCANPIACPAPLFTPATKADSGHDINISEAEAAAVVGADLLARIKAITMACTPPARRTPPRAASCWPTPSSSSA